MAAVPITINGVLCDKLGRTIMPCMIVGEASITGLGVGGGPVIPPPSGEKPPIDVPPPSIWPPGPGIDFPSHPIVIPPPIDPDKPPVIPPGSLIDWKPVWTPDRGWFIVGIPNVPHPAPSG